MFILKLIYTVYLFLPTFISNGAPIIIKNVPWLKRFNKPIYETYLGKNKTYRWFIAWTVFAILFSIFQFWGTKYLTLETLSSFYYEIIDSYQTAALAWFLQWFWALLWDSIKSFFKRRLWIKPGKPWPIIDWIDYIIGGILLFSFIYIPSIFAMFLLFVISPIAWFVANVIAYFMGWKDVWY